MFDRFTHRSKAVMNLARKQSQRLNHEYLGTEHILLGLVQEGSGVAANVLKNMGIDLSKIRTEVEKIVKTGPSMVTMGQLPFTPRAKKVLELSMEEAGSLGHNYIGTEHLLLGLIKENVGIAACALSKLGVHYEPARAEVFSYLLKSNETKADRLEGIQHAGPSVSPHPQRLLAFKLTLDQLRLLGEHAAADALQKVIDKLARESN